MDAASSAVAVAVSASFPLRRPHNKALFLPPHTLSPTSFNFNLALSPRRHLPSSSTSSTAASSSSSSRPLPSLSSDCVLRELGHWLVSTDVPPPGLDSKPKVINFYVGMLQRVRGSERDAQMCIYDASCEIPFGFRCQVDEDTARQLARIPGVLAVRPDPDHIPLKKDYSDRQPNYLSDPNIGSPWLFPLGTTKHWLVQMDKPGVGVVTKAQMVDYYAQILAKVLGNEKDAQMCIYHVSWLSNYGFCCEIDEECARELADIPGILSVQPDENYESEIKDYGGSNLQNATGSAASSGADHTSPIRTKKLFVTGLSFYTSEKTLRAAFEGFGELVQVKIIMDKISKRSKGYAFVEYTTEEAASAALKEMNGKIINGWMIVVDVAKSNPPRHSKSHTR
ncbi:organelle RRM domain-containing protein 1, chloroplastic [Rhodamnia argentea]|uniref:Organelle RRM domain-containing protein 1, chloroplastic n=1 Tax=Rhodamnia argentea TaxID=178133 RepID=A0A8B8QRD3_9MYRT|nr:organelle RRM domain-containing protein 1, chloroplastic [Rhodamnia argentea]